LQVGEFAAFQPTNSEAADKAAFKHLTEFLETLTKQRTYRFSFWNTEHFYILGRGVDQETANWAGVVLRSRFTYNP
jgi:hypothetical protein